MRAAGFWAFAQASSGDRPDIRIGPGTVREQRDLGADLVEIVQPDAPFLVDSVMAEVVAAGAEILAMFHPVLETAAGRRSTIQVWIEPMGDEAWPHLAEGLRTTLADVRLAVGDFAAMTALMERSIAELKAAAPRGGTGSDPANLEEDLAFLRWLDAGQFVFLGARSYDYPRALDGEYAAEEPEVVAGSGLGLLRDPDRVVLRRGSEPAVLSPQMRRELANAPPLIVAKSNLKSVVHRRVYMDYVGVRRYGPDGKPSGETRFVGLFTAQAYDEPVRNVPLVRRKLDGVMARAGQAVGSHNAMRLTNILETYPRDELFQASEDELLEIALGVLHLSDRPRVKLFVQACDQDQPLPSRSCSTRTRERYDARLREEVGQLLAEGVRQPRLRWPTAELFDAPLAQVHYIVGVAATAPRPGSGLASSAPSRSWPAPGATTAGRWCAAGPRPIRRQRFWRSGPTPSRAGYRGLYGRAEEQVRPGGRQPARAGCSARDPRGSPGQRRPPELPLQTLQRRRAAGASRCAADPRQHGPQGAVGRGVRAKPGGSQRHEQHEVWAHEFALDDPRGENLSFEAVRQVFEDAFLAIWAGQAESDAFNRLVLELSLPWRLAALIRALARYRLQSGLDPSPAVQQQALSDHPEVAGLILELFRLRLDPTLELGAEARAGEVKSTLAGIEEALQAVDSLDADRALRRLAALTAAIQRTNFYQPGADGRPKPYISFKVASRELADLPDPKPFREIFVASPAVEGVHLRLGPVACKGLLA